MTCPFNEHGREDRSWPKAKHHFSFGRCKDAARKGLGSLLVWNDDKIAPNTGLPSHPHANMETITYVLVGAVPHKDSLGNEDRTEAGDDRVMGAGTGIRHTEYNAEQQPMRNCKIWITRSANGGSPAWGSQPFPKADRSGRFVTLAFLNTLSPAVKVRIAAAARACAVNPMLFHRSHFPTPVNSRLLTRTWQPCWQVGLAWRSL